jgi:hypothetical protein
MVIKKKGVRIKNEKKMKRLKMWLWVNNSR